MMSETIIIAREVIPPLATPARPRKTYSMVEFCDRPHNKSLILRRANADRKTVFLPEKVLLGSSSAFRKDE
jgi:hypothetical protein